MVTTPPRTFSAVFDATPEANERLQIEAVLGAARFAASLLPADGLNPVEPLPRLIAAQDGAFFAPGMAMLERVYDAAGKAGVRVLLDGHGGDEVVSHGFGRLGELARAGRWTTFLSAASAVAGLYGRSRLYTAWRFGLGYGSGPAWAAIRRCIRWSRRRRAGTTLPGQGPDWAVLASGLRGRTGIAERLSARRAQGQAVFADEQAAHRATLESGFVVYALEVLDKLGAEKGLEPRFPFMDRRVVEFCLGLPAEAKLGAGFTRLVLRRAMRGLLPPAVLWRPDKLDFGTHLAAGLRNHALAELDALILPESSSLAAYFDMTHLRAARERLLDAGRRVPGADLHLLWRALVLGTWLREGRAGAGAETETPAVRDAIPEATS